MLKDTGTLQYDTSTSTTSSPSASSTSGMGTPTAHRAPCAPWRPDGGNPGDGPGLRRTPREPNAAPARRLAVVISSKGMASTNRSVASFTRSPRSRRRSDRRSTRRDGRAPPASTRRTGARQPVAEDGVGRLARPDQDRAVKELDDGLTARCRSRLGLGKPRLSPTRQHRPMRSSRTPTPIAIHAVALDIDDGEALTLHRLNRVPPQLRDHHVTRCLRPPPLPPAVHTTARATPQHPTRNPLRSRRWRS